MQPVRTTGSSVLGEFGGLGLPVEGHLWWDKRNWGYRNFEAKDELHASYATLMAKLEGLVPRGSGGGGLHPDHRLRGRGERVDDL